MRKLHPLLKLITKLTDDERRTVLFYLNSAGLDGVYECIHNGIANPTIYTGDQNQLKEKLASQKGQYLSLLADDPDPVKKHKKLLKVSDSVGEVIKLVLPVLENHLKF